MRMRMKVKDIVGLYNMCGLTQNTVRKVRGRRREGGTDNENGRIEEVG